MEEQAQVQGIVDSAQAVANDLSLSGNHIASARVTALVQLARVLWTRLQPKPESETEAKKPPRLEAV